jgi:hypothetical protein
VKAVMNKVALMLKDALATDEDAKRAVEIAKNG